MHTGCEQCLVATVTAQGAATAAAAASASLPVSQGWVLLPAEAILKNIQAVQVRQNLPVSDSLKQTNVSPVNLDIEMETGTGKTYCYIKTMFELNRQYGFSKFIVRPIAPPAEWKSELDLLAVAVGSLQT